MADKLGTMVGGGSFSKETVLAVWKKGVTDPKYPADTYRKDMRGSWMKYEDYGNTDSSYGWQVDHIKPKAKGGGDELSNLQPLFWKNNQAKGDAWPWNP